MGGVGKGRRSDLDEIRREVVVVVGEGAQKRKKEKKENPPAFVLLRWESLHLITKAVMRYLKRFTPRA